MEADDPRLDRELENALGAGRFAAIEVGEGEYLLAFDLDADARARGGAALARDPAPLDQPEDRARAHGRRAARGAQDPGVDPAAAAAGLRQLRPRRPQRADGDGGRRLLRLHPAVAARSWASRSPTSPATACRRRSRCATSTWACAWASARDFKIVRTVERLNRIIHESTLTSRFVSMFYGELELNGIFIYVNAGHPPPFHLGAGGDVTFLESGGVVLGPLADASYERGFVLIQPGDLLVLYTDGIIEARPRGGPRRVRRRSAGRGGAPVSAQAGAGDHGGGVRRRRALLRRRRAVGRSHRGGGALPDRAGESLLAGALSLLRRRRRRRCGRRDHRAHGQIERLAPAVLREVAEAPARGPSGFPLLPRVIRHEGRLNRALEIPTGTRTDLATHPTSARRRPSAVRISRAPLPVRMVIRSQ